MSRAEEWPPEMVQEFELVILIDLSARLRKGAQGSGMTLTRAECAVLVKKFFKRPIRPDRRRRYDYLAIAIDSFMFPGSVEAGVTHAARTHGVSRATVYAARRRAAPEIKKSRYFQK